MWSKLDDLKHLIVPKSNTINYIIIINLNKTITQYEHIFQRQIFIK